jgi:molecular chaperone DnaK (HSP70)
MKDEKLRDKFSDDEKQKLDQLLNENQSWMDTNPEADAEQYQEKMRQLEQVYTPIIQRIYSS